MVRFLWCDIQKSFLRRHCNDSILSRSSLLRPGRRKYSAIFANFSFLFLLTVSSPLMVASDGLRATVVAVRSDHLLSSNFSSLNRNLKGFTVKLSLHQPQRVRHPPWTQVNEECSSCRSPFFLMVLFHVYSSVSICCFLFPQITLSSSFLICVESFPREQ